MTLKLNRTQLARIVPAFMDGKMNKLFEFGSVIGHGILLNEGYFIT